MRSLVLLSMGVSACVLGAEPNDAAILKKMLAVAAEAKVAPRTGFDAATLSQLRELAKGISDPELGDKARKLDLEVARLRHIHVRFVLGEVKRLKGKSITEPGGPDWLVKAVGPENMGLFTKLTEIELNEHTDGHAEKKARPKGEAVDDVWLKNVEILPDLKRLEISGTGISDAGLVHLRNLKSLERLNVCLTPITDAGIKHLSGLVNLKRLVICSTKVTGAGFADVPDWPHIESINLHSCAVSDQGLAAIGRFGNLQRLEIVHSKVTDAGLKHIGKLTNLRQLHIASHDTTREGLAFIDGLTKLYELDLYEQLASNESLARVGKLTDLKMLGLFVGPADDIGLASLKGLSKLEKLTIGGLGKVTDAGVEHLARLKSLRQLKVSGTKISEAGMTRLREALPMTKIMK